MLPVKQIEMQSHFSNLFCVSLFKYLIMWVKDNK